MLFLSGQVSGAVAAENAYNSRDLCDHDTDWEGRARAYSKTSLLIRRQISPLVATALLGKLRSKMTLYLTTGKSRPVRFAPRSATSARGCRLFSKWSQNSWLTNPSAFSSHCNH
jgi:hypothetical protein